MSDPQEITSLADVIAGKGVPFEVNGASFRIRPPTTEEYDDAMAMERMVLKAWQADPALAHLRDVPCSETERASYEAMIADLDARFHAAADGSAEKDDLAGQIAGLQRSLDKRTMLDEVASDRALVARDRYLLQRLLVDADGRPIFNPRAADFPEQWERLPMQVKNAGRPAIWLVLRMVRQAPFSLDRLRAPRPA